LMIASTAPFLDAGAVSLSCGVSRFTTGELEGCGCEVAALHQALQQALPLIGRQSPPSQGLENRMHVARFLSARTGSALLA
jgi:hypothetical protein